MAKQRAASLACTVSLLLAGCDGPPPARTGSGNAIANETAAATANWDATDACGLLDKAAVGAALNDKVTETSLALVHQPSGAEAATSECTYMLAGGGRATLMTRNSPIADNTPAAMAQARKSTEQSVSAFSDKKVEDVTGIGKAAFFVPGINQLNVFIDESKFVVLTIGSAPEPSAKATAVELIRKIRN
jgi:hypothetical protein